MIRITRKMGKRSYEYTPGTNVPEGWDITDEKGNVFPTKELYEASLKTVEDNKTSTKKRVIKKKATN